MPKNQNTPPPPKKNNQTAKLFFFKLKSDKEFEKNCQQF